ncbi:MAG: SURF1 family protein [Rhodobacteraceae bacterium]|nr:SURF1 family protein [Paracoccaceae bacterium]
MRRYLFPLILGLAGCAVLLSLGSWQLRRLAWKEDLLAAINARIGSAPVALSSLPAPDPQKDRYLPVQVSGTTGDDLLVLSGVKDIGAGYEVISTLTTPDGRRILLDRGFIPEDQRHIPRPPVQMTVTGNLLWPREEDSYTPAPDQGQRLWFARNVTSMSQFLQTEPLLVVARQAEGQDPAIMPVPVDTSGIPNDHLGYAITWFSLAAVWAGMTAYLLWRIRQRTD